jgi:hypothetical protein
MPLHSGTPPPPFTAHNDDLFEPEEAWNAWADVAHPAERFDNATDALHTFQPIRSMIRQSLALDSHSDFSDSDESDESSHNAPVHEARESVPTLAPPALTAGFKRHSRENSEDADDGADDSLQCAICTKLAEDAVQTPCCGTLNCRACIKRWLATPSSRSNCAFCRAFVNPNSLITDIRAERDSAAAIRRCSFSEHGCDAKGSRKDMLEHERQCQCVPATVLRHRIQQLERENSSLKAEHSSWKASSRDELQQLYSQIRCVQRQLGSSQDTIQKMTASAKLHAENIQMHKKTAEDFLNCCLWPDSGVQAMKALHKVPCVYKSQRRHFQERFELVFDFYNTDVCIKESNFNVSVLFRRRPGITFFPTDDLTVTLLHPSQPQLNVTIRLDRDEWLVLDSGDTHICENFAASKTVDEFCVNGNIYLAHSLCGLGSRWDEQHDDRQYVCHCGVQLTATCHHVCRDIPKQERLKKYRLRMEERLKVAKENEKLAEENVRASEQKLREAAAAAAVRPAVTGGGWGRAGGWGTYSWDFPPAL